MPLNQPTLAPQQQRSRDTLDRLLSATIRVLEEHGLAGAVIPRIATAADVAPATIYRRFADKNALIRAAFLHMLRQSNETNRQYLWPSLKCDTVIATVRRLMLGLFGQYRRYPGLLRAVRQFAEADADLDFVRESQALMAKNLELVVEVLLSHSDQIVHPFPQRGVQIAVLTALSAIEAITLEPTSLWDVVKPLSDEELAEELTQWFVAYLTNVPSTINGLGKSDGKKSRRSTVRSKRAS